VLLSDNICISLVILNQVNFIYFMVELIITRVFLYIRIVLVAGNVCVMRSITNSEHFQTPAK